MKYVNWEKRLDDYVLSRLLTPFSWGFNDCVTFSTGGIEAMSGMNPAFFAKDKYKSKAEALKILLRFKLETFEDLITKIFKETPMRLLGPDELVMYGDIVLADITNLDPTAVGATAGVVDRDGLTIFPGKEGLVKLRITEARNVWRV